MTTKEEQLERTYSIMNQFIWYDYPMSEAAKIAAPDVMGYGTNLDEKILDFAGFCQLIDSQRVQGKEVRDVRIEINPVFRKFLGDTSVAIYVDEIIFKMRVKDQDNELFLRVSWLFEFRQDKWVLTHWHGSVPVASEGDPWQINLWKKKNDELQKKVDDQTTELRKSLDQLKSTQAQLIQSEKMASLGELTAGIAHEIQNPLNFVNNFSEVNAELIQELNQEAEKGNLTEVKHIAKAIQENEKKIVHHGKRADAIVKGMLQHSRSSSGIKEPTDINALCDEYVRLTYHGLRAKDKAFNATIRTDFDPTLAPVQVIPQDIGRAILNLLTNAFYAVNERHKNDTGTYVPTVTVNTRKKGGKTVISVKDNGNGIPRQVLDKIFQPFFTTKPTGHGTGLGLSLSYDIITKGHQGELRVETQEGQGAEFIIELPL